MVQWGYGYYSGLYLAATKSGGIFYRINFTKGKLKGGGAPEDVYRTFMTGLNGTAMPSFYDIFAEPDGESLFEGDAWHLVSYVLSLRKERP